MDGNPTLFDAVAKAKKSSMPADNIDRAIKRGAGLEAVQRTGSRLCMKAMVQMVWRS